MKSDLAARMAANPEATAARNRLQGQAAHASGKGFEAELDDTQKAYAFRRWGSLRAHYPRTVKTPKGLVWMKGSNPVDYSGHVNLERWDQALPDTCFKGWRCCTPERGQRVPYVFDAKRVQDAPSYLHNPERVAQLLQLREDGRAGAAAFLLVQAAAVERVFIVGPAFLEQLVRGERVTLYEKPRGQPPIFHLPSCGYVLGFGWNFGPLIPLACPALFPP